MAVTPARQRLTLSSQLISLIALATIVTAGRGRHSGMANAKLAIKPDDQTIRDLFLLAFYEVPDFQREYVWKPKKEVQQLLEDLIQAFRDNEPDYFLGSIVYFPNEDGTRALVDGQQRLTTLILLLAALQSLLKEPPVVLSKAIRDVDPKGLNDDVRFRVELQYSEITKTLEDLCSSKREVLKAGHGGPALLVAAYDKCVKHLSEELGEEDEVELSDFFSYVWNSTHVVTIETPDLRSAYKIFQTLNDRGKALNASDLLRNYLFKSAASDKSTQDGIRDSWRDMTKVLREAGEGTQVRFLRYYLMAMFGLTRDEAKGLDPKDKRANIIRADDMFDWITRHDDLLRAKKAPKAFARTLLASARAYANFLGGRDARGKRVEALENIGHQRTGVRQHLCLLLAGRHLPDEAFARLSDGLENLTFAYALAGHPWNNLEKRLPGWSSMIRRCRSDQDVDDFIQTEVVSEIEPLADRVWKELDAIYAKSPSLAKYLLARLTHFAQAAAFAGGQMSQLMDSKVSVEHILPRVLKNPEKAKAANWQDFGAVSREEASAYVERLGNLCLVDWGVNSQLSSHTYAAAPEGSPANYRTKRDRLPYVPWLLTRTIASSASPNKPDDKATAGQDKFITKFRLAPPAHRWNAKEVVRRQKYLLEMIKVVWPLLPEPAPTSEVSALPLPDPQVELQQLVKRGEGESREFKSSIRYDMKLESDNKDLVLGPVHTVSAFMNTSGGALLFGVSDKGVPLGLEEDLALFKEGGKDAFERYFRQALINAVGAKFTTGVSVSFPELDGKMICRVDVEPSLKPAFVRKKIEGIEQKFFYIRSGNETRQLDAEAAHDYIDSHW